MPKKLDLFRPLALLNINLVFSCSSQKKIFNIKTQKVIVTHFFSGFMIVLGNMEGSNVFCLSSRSLPLVNI